MGSNADQLEALRVILVGPTGLDAAFRRDPGFELIRASTPLDAIGELADPLDSTSPGHAVVIIDPRVEPEPTDTHGTGDLAEFLAGLRRVDPTVRVLRVCRNGTSTPAGYDGQVEPKADADTLRRFLEEGSDRCTPCQATPQVASTLQAIEPKPTPAPTQAQAPPPEPMPLRTTAKVRTPTGTSPTD